MAGKKQNTTDLKRRIRDSLTLVGPMTQKELFRCLGSLGYGRRIVTQTLSFMIGNKSGGVFIDNARVSVSLKKYPKYHLYSLS